MTGSALSRKIPISSAMHGTMSRAGGTSRAWPGSRKPRCMSTTRSAVRPGTSGIACSKASRRSITSTRARSALPGRDGECVRDVADGLDGPFVVEDDCDHVEAAGRLPDALQLQVAIGQLAQTILLSGIDAGLGRVALDHVPSRLHLDEDERLAFPRDQVDLAGPRADVLVEDLVTAAREEAGSGLLSFEPRRSASVG